MRGEESEKNMFHLPYLPPCHGIPTPSGVASTSLYRSRVFRSMDQVDISHVKFSG